MTKKKMLYIGIYLLLIILSTALLGSKKLLENKMSLIIFYVMSLGLIIYINSYTEKFEVYLAFGQTRKEIFKNIYTNILIMILFAFLGVVINVITKAILFKNVNIVDELIRFYENGSLYLFSVSISFLVMILFKNKYINLVIVAITFVMFLCNIMSLFIFLGFILIVLSVILLFLNKYYIMKIKVKQ